MEYMTADCSLDSLTHLVHVSSDYEQILADSASLEVVDWLLIPHQLVLNAAIFLDTSPQVESEGVEQRSSTGPQSVQAKISIRALLK
jgi:hypothetical protein